MGSAATVAEMMSRALLLFFCASPIALFALALAHRVVLRLFS